MCEILDGKALAKTIRAEVAQKVKLLADKNVHPKLAVIFAGDNPSSKIYVSNKTKACAEAGIATEEVILPASTNEADLANQISLLNDDATVHAILVQLPLPSHINAQNILAAVVPHKDVDGFHPVNMGRLMLGLPGIRPCTPLGIMRLIHATGIDLIGKRAVVVGRSAIVGKPVAAMLLEANATVTICHSKTADIPAIIKESSIVVAAIGRPRFIKGEWINKGAVVIDVGINRLADGSICGDVDFDAAKTRAGYITPVPGGVGPMTIAMLLENTVSLASRSS